MLPLIILTATLLVIILSIREAVLLLTRVGLSIVGTSGGEIILPINAADDVTFLQGVDLNP